MANALGSAVRLLASVSIILVTSGCRHRAPESAEPQEAIPAAGTQATEAREEHTSTGTPIPGLSENAKTPEVISSSLGEQEGAFQQRLLEWANEVEQLSTGITLLENHPGWKELTGIILASASITAIEGAAVAERKTRASVGKWSRKWDAPGEKVLAKYLSIAERSKSLKEQHAELVAAMVALHARVRTEVIQPAIAGDSDNRPSGLYALIDPMGYERLLAKSEKDQETRVETARRASEKLDQQAEQMRNLCALDALGLLRCTVPRRQPSANRQELPSGHTNAASDGPSDLGTSQDTTPARRAPPMAALNVTPNAYGLGVNADQFGHPHTYRLQDGEKLAPIFNSDVKRNAYGLGVHSDQFGRPVYDSPQ